MPVSAQDVKVLRERTGAGVMECRNALEEAAGDVERAVELLKHRGLAIAEKKAERQTSQGLIESYIHAGGRIGAIVEVNCETDFVARTDVFKNLAHELAMQVAAMGPVSVSDGDLPPGAEGDPSDLCLLKQAYFRDPSRKVSEIITEAIGQTGENIRVSRFARFELGQSA